MIFFGFFKILKIPLDFEARIILGILQESCLHSTLPRNNAPLRDVITFDQSSLIARVRVFLFFGFVKKTLFSHTVSWSRT